MFKKNLEYYRLRKHLSKKELADACGISAMAITNYEKGDRLPSSSIMKNLAKALDIKVLDLLSSRGGKVIFSKAEYRKSSSLNKNDEKLIWSSVSDYFERFYSIVDILGENVLPSFLDTHTLPLSNDDEENSSALREYLQMPRLGPIKNLVESLENNGILVYFCDVDNDGFLGLNGFANQRPFIVANKNMSDERNRSTIAHELAHLFFDWENSPYHEEKEIERKATAIAGAFLFPKSDAQRELGLKRRYVSMDMSSVCKEYGISMYLLVKRAELLGIIGSASSKKFYIWANAHGWKKNEPSWFDYKEESSLFEQFVKRAIAEEEISYQKGSELLRMPIKELMEQCEIYDKETCEF